MKVTPEMVNRFLSWPLPRDFAPDCGIAFDGRKDDQWNKNKTWPVGTNLLSADQAKTMLEHVLANEGGVTVSLDAFNRLSALHGEKFTLARRFLDTARAALDLASQCHINVPDDQVAALAAAIEAHDKDLYGPGRPVPPHRSGDGSASLSVDRPPFADGAPDYCKHKVHRSKQCQLCAESSGSTSRSHTL